MHGTVLHVAQLVDRSPMRDRDWPRTKLAGLDSATAGASARLLRLLTLGRMYKHLIVVIAAILFKHFRI